MAVTSGDAGDAGDAWPRVDIEFGVSSRVFARGVMPDTRRTQVRLHPGRLLIAIQSERRPFNDDIHWPCRGFERTTGAVTCLFSRSV